MNLENDLNEAILKITMKIRTEYPELSKYLNEMVVTIPDVATPEMTNKVLLDYYKSLEAMLKKYDATHEAAV
jgi:AAA15 family ATPase/GTPase